jgi:NADPH:quinone reductase-like Zn-dependent oxidoreductase
LISFGIAATSKGGVRVIPFTLLVVVLFMLFRDGKQAMISPNLAELAPANLDWYRETMAVLLEMLAAGSIKPLVAERIPLVEAVHAYEFIERGSYAGKVVLVPSL